MSRFSQKFWRACSHLRTGIRQLYSGCFIPNSCITYYSDRWPRVKDSAPFFCVLKLQRKRNNTYIWLSYNVLWTWFHSSISSISLLPLELSNVPDWFWVFLGTKTVLVMLSNSFCNPFIYERCLSKHRETIANIFQAFNFCAKINKQTKTNQ